MIEPDKVEPDHEIPQDISYDCDAKADRAISGRRGSNQRLKDPWVAFFELADELENRESPTV